MPLKDKFSVSSLITFLLPTIVSVSIVVIFFLYVYKPSLNIYVVDNKKLFEGFRMTKEIQKQGEHFLKLQKVKLDSLNIALALTNNAISKMSLQEAIVLEKNNIEVFNTNFNVTETEKIWKRINGYIQEYAKLKEYDLIIGSQLQGDIHYVDAKMDITTDLINYINKKYEGFN